MASWMKDHLAVFASIGGNDMNRHLSVISLFCGPGGLDQGFKNQGFISRLAYDIDEACVTTHRHNHPEASASIEDLSIIPTEKVISDWREQCDEPPTGIIGGPPCQSFSVSNVHQSDKDPRHKLPEHYARILNAANTEFDLDFFVFENVPGLLTGKHIARFKRFTRLFEEAGFNVFQGTLDAQDFGVPQVRPRVFVVGLNKKKYPGVEFEFPTATCRKARTVRDVIWGLPDPVYYSPKLTPDTIPFHPNHWCMVPRSPKFTNGSLVPGQIWGRSFRVLEWDEPSYTVAYGHREVHVHPNCKRRLSVFESMLLQGFPPEYVLCGTLSAQIRQVSEAVAPPVGAALANALFKIISGSKMGSKCIANELSDERRIEAIV